jgi:hypothetical protein
LMKGHDGPHQHRQEAEQPSLQQQIRILEIAVDCYHLWSSIWIFSCGGWITWMVDEGLLTEEPQERYETGFTYGGFSSSGMAPFNHITEKGKQFLAYHIPAEW